jgi:hypothetical protein
MRYYGNLWDCVSPLDFDREGEMMLSGIFVYII